MVVCDRCLYSTGIKNWRMGAPDRARSLFVRFVNGHTEHTKNQSLIMACSAVRRCEHLGLCGLGLRGLPVWLCAFVASWPVWPWHSLPACVAPWDVPACVALASVARNKIIPPCCDSLVCARKGPAYWTLRRSGLACTVWSGGCQMQCAFHLHQQH